MHTSRHGLSSRISRFICLFMLAAACGSAGAVEQWVYSAAPSVYVRGIVRFANTPVSGQSVVYASTLGAGVLKITRNGTLITTTQINNGLALDRVRTIAATDVNTLFAAVESYGVFKSTNGGASWTAANGSGATALGCVTLRNMSVRSVSEIWAVTACRRNSGIYRSLDGGATWSRIGMATIPDDAAVGSLTFNGTGVGTVVVASTARDGMFRSPDNGLTWTQINNGIPAPAGVNRLTVQNASFLANATQMLAYVEGQGVFRTVDSGATWTPSGTGIPANTHALGGISRESSTLFYLGTDKGPVYRTTDGGLSWSAWGNTGNQEKNSFVRGVTPDATAAGRYWLHSINGIAVTDDNGLTFQEVTTPAGYATSTALDGTGNAAYAVNQYIFKIPNLYNPDWNTQAVDITNGLPSSVGGVLVDPSVAGTLYATLPNRGVYKTVNDGLTWTPLPLPNLNPNATPTLALAVGDTQVVYAGLDNRYDTATGGGFFKSVNGGGTWTESSTGLSSPAARQVNSIAVQADPSILLIATDDGIYRSVNGGASWSLSFAIDFGLPTRPPFSSVRFDAVNAANAWAVANDVEPNGTVRPSSGVYKAIGTAWAENPVLGGERVVQVRSEANGRVFALIHRDLTSQAVLTTKDGGFTWQDFANGLQESDGVNLTQTSGALGSHVVLASTVSGVYVLDKPQLTVSVSGSGSVSSSPVAIACPGTCTAKIYDNELVTLAATPSTGESLVAWGGACTGNGACQVTMNGAQSVGATFTCVADADGDGIPNCFEATEGRNQFVKDNDILANARLFAMQQYRDFLNREGDAGGIDFWTSQINSASVSRGQVVESFFNSAEFQGSVSPVVRLYFAYFLRVPDYGGLQFWINYSKTNSLDAVSNNFAASPEFQNTYGPLNNTQYVTLVYNNVLGRAPDNDGLNFWVNQLNTAQHTRGQVMLAFSESPEYQAVSFSKVYVTMIYVGMLRRSPDDGGFNFWTGYMNSGNSGLALIDGFLAASEYRSRFMP
jgi:hypothetical protein